MWALRKSGVRFRGIVKDDGTVERWQQPKLGPWEVRVAILPSRGPSIRRWLCSDELHNEDAGRVDVLHERPRGCRRSAMSRKKY
jgi:hypothetical protein